MPDGTAAPLAFIPSYGTPDCTEKNGGALWTRPPAVPAVRYPHIWYGNINEDDHDPDYCPPYYHKTAQIDSLRINLNLQGEAGTGPIAVTSSVVSFSGIIASVGDITSATKVSAPVGAFVSKTFDIPHPTKEKKRLVYACLEGPENGVYVRGRLTGNNVIDLPDFWDGLVNPEDMTINLTPIGSWQELFVKEVQWGKKVVVRNNAGGPINADYYIVARRLDDDLIVEYEGESHTDYPGGNEGYSFSWENDNMERLVKEVVREKLDELEKGS